MTPNTTSHPNFNRPLMDYAQALHRIQFAASAQGKAVAAVLCHQIEKKLETLQNAYEKLPGQRHGRWFLSAGYESSHANIRNQCAYLKKEIDDIRASETIGNEHDESFPIDQTLEEISKLLEATAEDLSCLSQWIVITVSNEPTKSEQISIDDIFHMLEA